MENMPVKAWAVVFLLIIAIAGLVSALSVPDFFKGVQINKEKGQISESLINFENAVDSVDLPVFSISDETKQIAFAQIEEELAQNSRVSVIVWVNEGYTTGDVIKGLKNFKIKDNFEQLGGIVGTTDAESIRSMREDSRVNYVALDGQVVGHLMQSRNVIQANTVETNYGIRGNGIGVCHLDTGVNYNNINLAQAYRGGYDFVNNDPDPMDDHGHGTATAGVIASNGTLVRGISTEVNLLSVKVLDANGVGTESDVLAGINWCITNKNLYNISVISMSLGTLATYTPITSPASYEPALQIAYNSNIAIVASSGNYGSTSGISYPAVSPYVISVGATYDNNMGSQTWNFGTFSCNDPTVAVNGMTCFGNRASFLDLLAPGAIISTTGINGNIVPISGTSFSAPHVSGTIALMKQRNPQMTAAQIEQILKTTGYQVYDPLTALTFPRVNAWNAVNAVPYLNKTGSLGANNVINLHVNSQTGSGESYVLALSLGRTPGIPLADGRVIPLNIDDLLLLSIQSPSTVFMLNNLGVLNQNGYGQATITLPNIPGIENAEIYAGFITVNQTGQLTSVSNAVRL